MIYVGIDMAKKKFDYCIIDSELSVIKRGILINNIYGFSEFLRIIKKYKNIKLGIESTGIYHVNLYAYLINNNCSIILLNPMGTRNKAGEAISEGFPNLLRGILFSIYSLFSLFERSSALISVSIVPGSSELTIIPRSPSIMAMVREY